MFAKNMKTFGVIAVIATLVLGLFALALPGTVYASALERPGVPGGAGYGAGAGQTSAGNGAGAGQAAAGAGNTTAARSAGLLAPLSAAEQDALRQAILEEYGALNLYQSVIAQFGNVYPFSMVVRAEQQHINALVRQATKYGVAVPANPGLVDAPVFDRLSAACEAGAVAEIADAALYDELKPVVTHSDLLLVFNNLQSASLNSHLPAFQTCQ